MSSESKSMPKMYILVNMDLSLGKGKIAGQVGHVVRRMTSFYYDSYELMKTSEEATISFTKLDRLWDEWLTNGETKIVLKSNEKQMREFELSEKRNFPFAIYDAGRTQIPAGSFTALGFFPSYDLEAKLNDLKLL